MCIRDRNYIDTLPVSCKLLGTLFGVDGELLERQYRNHLSGYLKWESLPHAGDWPVSYTHLIVIDNPSDFP